MRDGGHRCRRADVRRQRSSRPARRRPPSPTIRPATDARRAAPTRERSSADRRADDRRARHDRRHRRPFPCPRTTSRPSRRSCRHFVDAEGLNGAGLIIVDRDHGVIHEDYWGEFDADRISLVASSTKMITAGVLLHLADQGLLDMDAPVADVAEWGAGQPDDHPGAARVEQLRSVGLLPDPAYLPYVCQYIVAGTIQECAAQSFTTPRRRCRRRSARHRVPLRRGAVAGRWGGGRGRVGQVVGRADRGDLRRAVRAGDARIQQPVRDRVRSVPSGSTTRRDSTPTRRRCCRRRTPTWRVAPT